MILPWCRTFKKGLSLFMVVSACVLNIPILSFSDSIEQNVTVAESEQKKKKKEEKNNDPMMIVSQGEKNLDTDPRSEVTESIDGMTMLYIGGGFVALAAVMGASGGGSSSNSPDVPVVGPNLNGNNWSGSITLVNKGYEGYQGISSSVSHSGSSVSITTTSTLDYGKYFSGTISSSGYMSMLDSTTGQTWTTYKGNASASRMALYDYVNGFTDLDKVILSR